MKILLFGVTCVGKSTTGKILSEKLGFDFFDMDLETVKYVGMPIDDFIDSYSRAKRDNIRASILANLIEGNDSNMVIAITNMLYNEYINKVVCYDDVLAIELQDTVQHIFDRLIFTDRDGQTLPDSHEYKMKHKSHYMEDIKEDIEFYKPSFAKIENKLFVDGRRQREVADLIIQTYLKDLKSPLPLK